MNPQKELTGDARIGDVGPMPVDTVPHAGVLRAAGAAAELAIAIGEQGYPLVVKAAGESDDGTLWATFKRKDTKVTTCKVGKHDLPETVKHITDFVRKR